MQLGGFHCNLISFLDPQCLTEPKQASLAAAIVDFMLGMIAIVIFVEEISAANRMDR